MDLKRIFVLTLLTISILNSLTITTRILSAESISYSVLVDLSHGQEVNGLEVLTRDLYDADIYILLKNSSDIDRLPPLVRLSTRVLYGSFDRIVAEGNKTLTLTDLGVDVVIIPQISPQSTFSNSELEELKRYLSSGSKALWISGSGDYGDGENVIREVNRVLGYLNSSLALDYVSIEDPDHSAGAPYRVIASIQPSSDLFFLTYGAERILMYRPGVIAYRNPIEDLWHPLNQDILKNHSDIKIIAVSSPSSVVTEYKLPPEGFSGRVYKSGEKGSYVLIAAQIMSSLNNSIIVVSTSSVIGDTLPIITTSYHGFRFDGVRFVRNMILWLSGVMEELKYVTRVSKMIQDSFSDLLSLIGNMSNSLNSAVNSLNITVSMLSSKVGEYSQRINEAASSAENISVAVAKISSNINDLSRSVGEYYRYSVSALILSAIAITLSVIFYMFRKK
ncbi:MAG: hypothetical protein ABWJ42_00905 [Sulfolobales archaeon]